MKLIYYFSIISVINVHDGYRSNLNTYHTISDFSVCFVYETSALLDGLNKLSSYQILLLNLSFDLKYMKVDKEVNFLFCAFKLDG